MPRRLRETRTSCQIEPLQQYGHESLVVQSEEWEVESIKDSRFHRNQLQYLVHWQGYDVSEDSWEPATHLKHAQEIVQEYHANHPSKPKPKRETKSRGRDSLRGGNVTNLSLIAIIPSLFAPFFHYSLLPRPGPSRLRSKTRPLQPQP